MCQPWLPTGADPFGGVANNVTALFVAASATIAMLMLATVVLAVALLVGHVEFGLLLVELLLTGEFALFWAVQTWDVWEPRDKHPGEAVPALANAPQPAR